MNNCRKRNRKHKGWKVGKSLVFYRIKKETGVAYSNLGREMHDKGLDRQAGAKSCGAF